MRAADPATAWGPDPVPFERMPHDRDPECGYPGHELEATLATFADQSRCTMVAVRAFYRRLKELGVYDDALILVHGDHGGGVAFDMTAADGSPSNSFEELPGLWGNPLPLLLVMLAVNVLVGVLGGSRYFGSPFIALAANLVAFFIRGGAKLLGLEHLGARPLSIWLFQASITYVVCGLIAGLVSGIVWFQATRPRQIGDEPAG